MARKTKFTTLSVHVRWMIRRDMAEVLAIEQVCFEWPWQEGDFIRCLRQRNAIGMVCEYGDRIVGYMIYELHKYRLRVLNFAVHEDWRFKGVGRAMVAKLIAKLSSDRRSRVVLEVRETNLDACLFWKRMGFRCTDVLRAFYVETAEDAYLFQYRHQQGAADGT